MAKKKTKIQTDLFGKPIKEGMHKKKRTVKIANPQLRRIRNELRNLLTEAKSEKMHEILDKKWELKHTEGFWDKTHPEYENLHKLSRELSCQENDLSYAYSASIIFCPACMRIDKDMTYNPVLEKWFCTECYEKNKSLEIELVEEGELSKEELSFP